MTQRMPESGLANPDRTGWSEKTSQFYDHYMDLRVGVTFPSSEAFLDSADPVLQPQTFMFERVEPNKTVFRLMATELVTIWGRDFTGMAIEEVFSPIVARRYLADPWDCHTLSCGLWERGDYGDMRNRVVTLEIMYMPLATPPGKPPRLIGLLAWTGLSTEKSPRQGLVSLKERRWIDTGYGVAMTPPDLFTVPID